MKQKNFVVQHKWSANVLCYFIFGHVCAVQASLELVISDWTWLRVCPLHLPPTSNNPQIHSTVQYQLAVEGATQFATPAQNSPVDGESSQTCSRTFTECASRIGDISFCGAALIELSPNLTAPLFRQQGVGTVRVFRVRGDLPPDCQFA